MDSAVKYSLISALAFLPIQATAQDDASNLLRIATTVSSHQQDVAQSSSDVDHDQPNTAINEAIEFTKDLTDRANNAFISTTNESQQLINFQNVLSEGLALDILGRFMLGSHRNTLTPEQETRYNTIFPDYITRLYAEQFKDIAGKNLEIINAAPFRRGDVFVRTQFFRDNGEAVNVDWRARKLRNGTHRMIDIIVSGVSIMTVKREEFSSFISNNGVEALITRLEDESKM